MCTNDLTTYVTINYKPKPFWSFIVNPSLFLTLPGPNSNDDRIVIFGLTKLYKKNTWPVFDSVWVWTLEAMDNHHLHRLENMKHYKMGKRISYLKNMQTKLLAQVIHSSVFVEYIGKELDKLDENWMGKDTEVDLFERQLTYFQDKMLEKSLTLNQELKEKIETLTQ